MRERREGGLERRRGERRVVRVAHTGLLTRISLTSTCRTSGLGACDASARRTCSRESPVEGWPMTWCRGGRVAGRESERFGQDKM